MERIVHYLVFEGEEREPVRVVSGGSRGGGFGEGDENGGEGK